jgi:hypothetical protein
MTTWKFEQWVNKKEIYARDMTLRDEFAAKAMQGLMGAIMSKSEIAEVAYMMADAMLAAREAK